MAVILCSFADKRLWRSKHRLLSQAAEMDVYDKVFFFDETDIDSAFLNQHKSFLNATTRGFGYWIWKPYVINKVLSLCNDGDIVHYVDVGCWLNKHGRSRFYEYIELVRESSNGILAFKNMYYDKFDCLVRYSLPERQWTKSDTLEYYGVLDDAAIANTEQIMATTFFIRKCAIAEELIKDWLDAWNTYHLVNDAESIIPNSNDFVEHRHDQSIFSILCKKQGVQTISYFEIFYPDLNSLRAEQPVWRAKADWSKIEHMPILAKRDKSYGLIKKLRIKLSALVGKVLA